MQVHIRKSLQEEHIFLASEKIFFLCKRQTVFLFLYKKIFCLCTEKTQEEALLGVHLRPVQEERDLLLAQDEDPLPAQGEDFLLVPNLLAQLRRREEDLLVQEEDFLLVQGERLLLAKGEDLLLAQDGDLLPLQADDGLLLQDEVFPVVQEEDVFLCREKHLLLVVYLAAVKDFFNF